MQAIVTKFCGPIGTQGATVIARAEAGQLSVPWDHSAEAEENHHAAAVALAVKLGWTHDNYGHLVSGSLPTNDGYAHVFTLREQDA